MAPQMVPQMVPLMLPLVPFHVDHGSNHYERLCHTDQEPQQCAAIHPGCFPSPIFIFVPLQGLPQSN